MNDPRNLRLCPLPHSVNTAVPTLPRGRPNFKQLKLPAVMEHCPAPSAPVVCLFLCRCPSAIPRLIVSVIVDPVDCVALWAFAHIGNEAVKRVLVAFADHPALANGYAATAIVRPRRAILVAASRFYIRQRSVKIVFAPLSHCLRSSRFHLQTEAAQRFLPGLLYKHHNLRQPLRFYRSGEGQWR